MYETVAGMHGSCILVHLMARSADIGSFYIRIILGFAKSPPRMACTTFTLFNNS
jgi:hypothetical protein